MILIRVESCPRVISPTTTLVVKACSGGNDMDIAKRGTTFCHGCKCRTGENICSRHRKTDGDVVILVRLDCWIKQAVAQRGKIALVIYLGIADQPQAYIRMDIKPGNARARSSIIGNGYVRTQCTPEITINKLDLLHPIVARIY